MTTTKPAVKTNLCDYFTSITMGQLEDMCDDPKRDKRGGQDVRAILTFDKDNGFFLSVQDGKIVYSVRESNGDPVKYRTIEQAIEVLQNMQVSTDVRLDISGSVTRR